MGKITMACLAVLIGTVIGNRDMDLFNAAKDGNLADVDNAIASGADPNWKNQDEGGYGALHFAAAYNLPVIVRSLLDAGADIELRTNYGHTPLWIASSAGSTDSVKTLIHLGADIDSPSDDGTTPLIIATCNALYDRHVSTVEVLINANASVRLSDNTGLTALHCMNRLAIAQLLLQSDADIRQQDNKGRTALHEAAYVNRTEIALLLLRKGAYAGQQDNDGNTPADIARERGYHQLANILDTATATPEYDLYMLACGDLIMFIAETLNYVLH